MTDLQEAIVDRLMVVKRIGVQWANGPLGLAIEALKARKMVGRADVTDTLGYPMVMCKALHNASNNLQSADDRRKLAITFFTAVAPRASAPRLTPKQHVRVALWCGQRAHLFVCRADCAFFTGVRERVDGYLAGGQLPDGGESVPPCPVLKARRWWGESVAPESLEYAVLRACNHAESAAQFTARQVWAGKHSFMAAGCAARVASRVKGLPGAVDFCLALAQQVGLKP
jgi:hypothetical protein